MTPSASGPRDNLLSILYMLLAVSGISMFPLVVLWSNGAAAPFLFGASLRIGELLGLLLFILLFQHYLLRNRSMMTLVIIHMISNKFPYINIALLWVIAGYFEYTLFAWSVRYIDLAVAVILFELWPVLLILLTSWLFRSSSRYNRITSFTWILLGLGFLGFIFVTLSQASSGDVFDFSLSLERVLGLVLVLLSALSAALLAFGFKWGADVSETIVDDSDVAAALDPVALRSLRDDLNLFCTIVSAMVGSLVGALMQGSIGFVSGETITLESCAIAIIGGILALAIPGVFWRKANIKTDNLAINSISYATPVLSLVWLGTLHYLAVQRVDLLLIGTAAIVSVNLLVSLEAETRLGFRSLVVSLWGFGTIVYLREEVVDTFLNDIITWRPSEYFEGLTMSATVFTLILSFRVSRLTARIADEEGLVFGILEKLAFLSRKGKVADEVLKHFSGFQSAGTANEMSQESKQVFRLLRRAINDKHLASEEEGSISEVMSQFNMLLHSRQRGMEFGELFAILMFAAITIVFGVFSRPDVAGWTAFLADFLAMLVSSIVVFLVVNLYDLQRERSGRWFSVQGTWYEVFTGGVGERRAERWLSIMVGLGVACGYGGLFWYKWQYLQAV